MPNLKNIDFKEGSALPTHSRGPVTREDLVRYAAASGDNNPIHLDENFAKEAGFPSVIAHGMLSMAYLADYIFWLLPESQFQVKRLSTRFRKVTFPGDVLEIGGSIKRFSSDKDQLTQLITISLWVKNQQGEITTDGEVDVQTLSH